MKKMVFCSILILFLCCGCSFAVVENNLLQTRTAKATERVHGKSMAERAADVKEKIGRIDGIQGSAVVVEGHTAIIGLRTDVDKKKQTQITNDVQATALQTDKDLYFVSVTTDETIVSAIEKEEKTRMP